MKTEKNLKITTILMHVFVKCVQLAVWWFVSLRLRRRRCCRSRALHRTTYAWQQQQPTHPNPINTQRTNATEIQ